MKSELPKVLHKVGGFPMLHHVLRTATTLEPQRIVVVIGHGGKAVERSVKQFDESIELVTQAEQKGTGHAVAQTAPILSNDTGDTLILYGDTPLITEQTLHKMRQARTRQDIVVLGFETENPEHYGRLVTHDDTLERIVEWKDASAKEKDINLCNSGVILIKNKILFDLVSSLENNNAANEYYLTDIIAAAHKRNISAGVVLCPETETAGVNTRLQLSIVEKEFQSRARIDALSNGITLTAPETVFFALDTQIGRDTIIGENVVFGPRTTVESGAEIRSFCHLEGCHISHGAIVGPFARIRPGAELAENVHVGNFVEIKNTILDENVKVGHLTYLGDATVGKDANIGAGTITCNYDGINKHRTEIGKKAFIGSDTMLIAPVKIGDNALTASGSVITKDVPADALAISRTTQLNKLGFVSRLFGKLRTEKTMKKTKDRSGKA